MRTLANSSLSIVSPVYNEEQGLTLFVEAVVEAMAGVEIADWSLLLVNDGSVDGSLALIKKLREKYPPLRFVDLSRNFGHQAALTAGLEFADGDIVVVMDSDLQDPPSLVPELLGAWEEGKDVVFARRAARAETGIRRLGFDLFHRFFRYCIDIPIPANVGVFGLMDRRVVGELKRLGERNRFLPGLHFWVGFERGYVDYERKERAAGEPKQSLRSLCNYALNGVFSFSYKPVRMLSYLGVLVALGAFALALFFTFKRLLGYEVAFMGFTTLVILISLLGGLQLMALGLLGEYLIRIYDEVKNRPLYLVKENESGPRK